MLGDLPGAAGVDGIAVAVADCGAGDQEVPLSWLALPCDAGLHGAEPLLPFGGTCPGATSSMRPTGVRISRTAESPLSPWPPYGAIRLLVAGHRTHGCLASTIQLAKPGLLDREMGHLTL